MFFQHLGKQLESIFQLIENASTSDMVNQLVGIVTVWITITIMIKGYQALAGKATDPVRDVVWDIFIKVCIMAFALNLGGYLTLVTDAMDNIYSWAGGGDNLYVQVDELFKNTKKLAGILYEKDSSLVPIAGVIGALLVYIGFGIGALPALIIIVVSQFVLKLVIMLAPFMFFALMFGWLKNMFSQWLSIFFANVLTVLIVSLVFEATVSKFNSFIEYSRANILSGFDLIYIGAKIVIFGILLYVIIEVAKTLAEKIATVGLESAMQGALGGTLSGVGRGGMATGKFSYAKGKDGYNYVKNKISERAKK